jgi:hypothetical protein
MEELLEGSSVAPDEDWVCNLRLIDDILEQHAAAQNATAQNADQVTQGAEELYIKVGCSRKAPYCHSKEWPESAASLKLAPDTHTRVLV